MLEGSNENSSRLSREDAAKIYGKFTLLLGRFFRRVHRSSPCHYYKQISEGYEDRDRFRYSAKTRLSIKKTVEIHQSSSVENCQLFSPLVTAFIHTAFAPSRCIMKRLFSSLGLTATALNATIVVVLSLLWRMHHWPNHVS